MSQGRGSAMQVVILLILVAYYQLQVAESAVYTVGDRGGWTFNTATWPNGKHFVAGDTIVFNYSPAIHNVVPVSRAGYQTCRSPIGAKVFTSGRDAIKLVRGQNFFICSFPGHCESGMKIAITAT